MSDDKKNLFSSYLRESILVKQSLLAKPDEIATISSLAEAIVKAIGNGNKILFAGNGGSAADAQHLAAEFISKFRFDRMPMPAISLSTDTSVLTAIGNDYGFEYLFARQLEAIASTGDILIAITTSGRSPNILQALKKSSEIGVKAAVITGAHGCMRAADWEIRVPSMVTSHIQECHITIGHFLCGFVEDYMHG